MQELTETEKKILTAHLNDFATMNVNDALHLLIDDTEKYNSTYGERDYVTFSNMFRFLCEDTDLLNDIDDTVADEYGSFPLGNCGTTMINNSNMSVLNFYFTDSNLKSIRYPNAIATNIGEYIASSYCTNLTEIYIPTLTDFDDDFTVIDLEFIKSYNGNLKIYTNRHLISSILSKATDLVMEKKMSEEGYDWLANSVLIAVKE